jgi:uncharacterized membrane protein YfcA
LSQPRSEWLFHTLRGLVLLMLGWAFGALYGLTSLGFLAIFLPISGALLGFAPVRATAAGWIAALCACVGALATYTQALSFHSYILMVWGAYILAGLVGNAIFPRRWRITLQAYLLLLLIAIGAGMAWQAYPTLSDGVFREAGTRIASPPQSAWFAVALGGGLAGLLGGMSGLGGGYVLVPVLVFAGIAPHLALWLSLWLMLPLGVVSGFVSLRRGTPTWSQEGWLGAGAFLGGVAGATWALSFSAGMLVLCFGAAMTTIAFVTWRFLSLVERASSPGDGSAHGAGR